MTMNEEHNDSETSASIHGDLYHILMINDIIVAVGENTKQNTDIDMFNPRCGVSQFLGKMRQKSSFVLSQAAVYPCEQACYSPCMSVIRQHQHVI